MDPQTQDYEHRITELKEQLKKLEQEHAKFKKDAAAIFTATLTEAYENRESVTLEKLGEVGALGYLKLPPRQTFSLAPINDINSPVFANAYPVRVTPAPAKVLPTFIVYIATRSVTADMDYEHTLLIRVQRDLLGSGDCEESWMPYVHQYLRNILMTKGFGSVQYAIAVALYAKALPIRWDPQAYHFIMQPAQSVYQIFSSHGLLVQVSFLRLLWTVSKHSSNPRESARFLDFITSAQIPTVGGGSKPLKDYFDVIAAQPKLLQKSIPDLAAALFEEEVWDSTGSSPSHCWLFELCGVRPGTARLVFYRETNVDGAESESTIISDELVFLVDNVNTTLYTTNNNTDELIHFEYDQSVQYDPRTYVRLADYDEYFGPVESNPVLVEYFWVRFHSNEIVDLALQDIDETLLDPAMTDEMFDNIDMSD